MTIRDIFTGITSIPLVKQELAQLKLQLETQAAITQTPLSPSHVVALDALSSAFGGFKEVLEHVSNTDNKVVELFTAVNSSHDVIAALITSVQGLEKAVLAGANQQTLTDLQNSNTALSTENAKLKDEIALAQVNPEELAKITAERDELKAKLDKLRESLS